MPWYRSLLVLVLCTGLAAAGDWPQWLGPTRDCASPESIKPWKDAPKIVWRRPVGEGHSSPVVANGKVVLHAKVKDQDAEEVVAFDAVSGEPGWRAEYARAPFKPLFGAGPRGTPAITADKVYTFGVTGVLSCFAAATGKQLWQVDTLKEFNAKNLGFGASCSPLLDGKHVLVNVGGEGASIVAFDKDSGQVAWKRLSDKASYSSPIAFGKGEDRQVVFLTAQGLVGLNPNDGSVYWQHPLVDLLSESSTTPVRIGHMLLGSSVTVGSVGLKLAIKEGKPTATQAWKNSALTCYFSTPVAVGEQVFMVTGTIVPPPSAALRCVEAKTGKELWNQPRVGKYHATLIRTGDDHLLMLDDAGNLLLLDPRAKKYHELARSKVCGPSWAHPALANGKLYIRDDKELICLQLGE